MEETIVRKRQSRLQGTTSFQVRFEEEVMSFSTLVEAYEFFRQLALPASLWDMSNNPYIILTKKAATGVYAD